MDVEAMSKLAQLVTHEPLWVDAPLFAEAAGIKENSVRWRFRALLAGVNGTRNLYEREVLSPRGGGLGGRLKQFDIARIFSDFPGKILEEELSRARELASRQTAMQFDAQGAGSEIANPKSPITNHSIVVTGNAILEKPAPPEQTALAFDSPLHALPERARPWAQARRRAIELLLGDRWRAWRGKTLHDIFIQKKTDFAIALAKDSIAAVPCGLVNWRQIDHELSHGVGNPKEKLTPAKVSSLWRWHGWYVNGRVGSDGRKRIGDAALGDLPRADAGFSRIFGAPPAKLDFYDEDSLAAEVAKLTPAGARAAALRLYEGQNPVFITEVLAAEFSKLGLAAAPSYSAVKRFLDSFPEPLKLWAGGNPQKFHNRCAPYALRDYSTVRVMQGWVLDHVLLDFAVYNNFIGALGRWTFPYAKANAAMRMWLTAFMDIRSRYIVGYAFSANPSSSSICSALRMGVLLTGRAPRFGLLDRGEDMKKMGLAKPDLPEAAHGALRRLIAAQWGDAGRVVFSIGEHPQSKPIERWFGTLHARFDKRVPSYCGDKPEHRPERCVRLLQQHGAWKKDGALGASPLPRASEAIRAASSWIEEFYNAAHHHRGHGMDGATPEQVFRAGFPLAEQKQAREQLDPRALDVFLWDVHQCKVFNGGCVRLYGAEYEPADAASLGALFPWTGREQKILVAADPHPNQLGHAVAKHPDTGEILGVLQSKQLLAWGADQELIREGQRLQRRAGKACKDYIELTHRASQRVASSMPAGPFGFLGEGFSATGTDNLKALPPAPRVPQSAAAAAPAKYTTFISDAVEEDRALFDKIEVED